MTPSAAPATPEAAAARLGSLDSPVLLRLPFSHFCRKAEWGLSLLGVPYRTLDTGLKGMRHVRRANPVERTVPVLVDGTRVIPGSHSILRFADDRRTESTPPLYPLDEKTVRQVVEWEAWADRDLGPAVRREAYRVLATQPAVYARSVRQRVRMELGKAQFRAVLEYLKAGPHEAEDPAVVHGAISRTVERLRGRDSGFLFADHATAADVATGALLEPIVPIGTLRGYDKADGWGEFVQFVRTVRPARLRRTAKRRVREADWRAFEVLNHAQDKLRRPEIGAPR